MTSDKDGESKLQQLVEIGTSHNAEGIKDVKSHGGKVVGLWGCYIPEEILYAADILPWHLIGSMKESTPLAGVHRSPATDAYNNHLLEALLDGELDFLDGWIVTNYDDDTKSMEYFTARVMLAGRSMILGLMAKISLWKALSRLAILYLPRLRRAT